MLNRKDLVKDLVLEMVQSSNTLDEKYQELIKKLYEPRLLPIHSKNIDVTWKALSDFVQPYQDKPYGRQIVPLKQRNSQKDCDILLHGCLFFSGIFVWVLCIGLGIYLSSGSSNDSALEAIIIGAAGIFLSFCVSVVCCCGLGYGQISCTGININSWKKQAREYRRDREVLRAAYQDAKVAFATLKTSLARPGKYPEVDIVTKEIFSFLPKNDDRPINKKKSLRL